MLGGAMKKPLIILDGFLILLIAVLGLALFHNVQEQSKEHSLSHKIRLKIKQNQIIWKSK